MSIDQAPAWEPNDGPQREFLARGEWEVLYGGAAGGGKTDALVMAATRYVGFPRYRGLLLRRTFPQLQEIQDRCRHFYPLLGGEFKASEHRWHWPTGSSIQLGHAQHEADIYSYQGKEYQFIGFDEAGQFTQHQYLYLFSRCRSTDPRIRPMVRSTSNPGGPGHAFLKQRFRIGSVEPGTPIIEEFVLPTTGEIFRASRVFIPATVYDNPVLLKADPLYLQRLLQLPELEKQRLLYGVWDAFAGQAFGDLNADLHGFDWDPPLEWEVFGSFDWGYAKPWSYGLYAVDYDGRIHRFAEAYGAKEEDGRYVDEGLRMTDAEIARRILDLEHEHRVKPRVRVADPAIWNKRPTRDSGSRGPSPQEGMANEGVYFVKADNARILGRQQVHQRLRLDEDGEPWVKIHKRCLAFWQTMPEMRESEKDPEDIETKETPDHVYDEFRYAMMTRPLRPKVQPVRDTGSFQAERRKLIAARRLAARRGIPLGEAYGRAR